ncbi:MAG: OmpA family protein [Bacteroidetes bacterium]|nr:OmpA family protein [Bacteroidota bacterium]MBP6427074.1 OmpA family protein [Bacteroidia bacterium]MBK7570297.1 OmpA family protein [Bacteroidota bacterium]MBK8363584.1 OmpA family protein [Bacteroidota bacterium]MBK9414647.1 OmpA family protein [Bacteroidota bacterium]
MKLFTILMSLLVIGSAESLSAQSGATNDSTQVRIKRDRMPYIKNFNTWDIGGHIGITYPNTDIAASTFTADNVKRELAFGLDVTKFLTHSFAFQGRFITGKMSGVDSNKPQYQYHTDVHYDLTINAYFQLGNVAFLKRTPNLAIYGAIGIGAINYTPYVSIDSGRTELTGIYSQYQQAFEIRDFAPTTELIIPFSVGAKYRIAKHFSLNLEYSLRTTNSDRMDGWDKLLSEDDDYSYLSAGLTFHIGGKDHMAEWFNPLQSVYTDLYDMKDKVDLMSMDTDKDGVADLFDKEPDTPEGVKVYGDGTAVDTDLDGIPDINDAEPFSAKYAKVDASGKEIDSDGDGVPDPQDMEPNTPKGTLVNQSGITIPGDGSADGSKAPFRNVDGYLPSIFFAWDSDEINKVFEESLAEISLVMKNNPELKFIISGNCDKIGSIVYNEKLGMRRAEAVKKYLVKNYKIDPDRLTTETMGNRIPLTDKTYINRRVDFSIDSRK